MVQIPQDYHGGHPSQYLQDHPTTIYKRVSMHFSPMQSTSLHICQAHRYHTNTIHLQQDPFLLSAPAARQNLGDQEDQVYHPPLDDQLHQEWPAHTHKSNPISEHTNVYSHENLPYFNTSCSGHWQAYFSLHCQINMNARTGTTPYCCTTCTQCSHHFLSIPSDQQVQASPRDQGYQHSQKGPGGHQDLVVLAHLEVQDCPLNQGGPTERSAPGCSHFHINKQPSAAVNTVKLTGGPGNPWLYKGVIEKQVISRM